MGTVAVRHLPGAGTPEPPGTVVRQAILHLVGSRLLLSDRPVVWDDAAGFRDYLHTHITNALDDAQLRSAVPGDTGTVDVADALARGQAGLVDASRTLATRLHDAIGGDRRVTAGVFAVVTCVRTGGRPFVALLKLDLGPAFQKRWHAGHLAVRRLTDTLPATGERLQKAAFVAAADPADSEYLRVVDRQVTGMPAQFFLDGFLHATMRFDDAELTRLYYQSMHAALRSLSGKVTERRLHTFSDFMYGNLARTDFDRGDVLAQLSDDERDVLAAEMAKRHLEPSFTLDPVVRDELTRTRRFQGDHGLRVEVDARYAPVVIEEGEPDRTGKRTIVLHTREWEPA